MRSQTSIFGSILAVAVTIVVAFVLLRMIWGYFFAVSPIELFDGLKPAMAEDLRGTVLVEGWDEGTETFLMDIPAHCPTQRLEYTAWAKYDTNTATVEFVVSKMDNEILTAGANDFTESVQDGANWSLVDNSVYALTARGRNARWRFSVTCD